MRVVRKFENVKTTTTSHFYPKRENSPSQRLVPISSSANRRPTEDTVRAGTPEKVYTAPKVREPIDRQRNQVPRLVAIERKKKLFRSYDLTQLFQSEGLDLPQIQASRFNWADLSLFDDTSFDDYSNEEWIEFVTTHGQILQAKLMLLEDARLAWPTVTILNYSPHTELFLVQYYSAPIESNPPPPTLRN